MFSLLKSSNFLFSSFLGVGVAYWVGFSSFIMEQYSNKFLQQCRCVCIISQWKHDANREKWEISGCTSIMHLGLIQKALGALWFIIQDVTKIIRDRSSRFWPLHHSWCTTDVAWSNSLMKPLYDITEIEEVNGWSNIEHLGLLQNWCHKDHNRQSWSYLHDHCSFAVLVASGICLVDQMYLFACQCVSAVYHKIVLFLECSLNYFCMTLLYLDTVRSDTLDISMWVVCLLSVKTLLGNNDGQMYCSALMDCYGYSLLCEVYNCSLLVFLSC